MTKAFLALAALSALIGAPLLYVGLNAVPLTELGERLLPTMVFSGAPCLAAAALALVGAAFNADLARQNARR